MAGVPTKKSNAPIRGLAMILIAVGILLAIWGLFSLTRHTEDDAVTASSSSATSTTSTQQPTASPTPASPAPPPPATPPAGHEGAVPPGEPGEGGGQPAPPPAPQPGHVPVSVLNNSTIPKLAENVSNDLRGQGWEISEVGNFPAAALPESTVFYTPGNAAEEKTAQDVAASLGIVAKPRTDVVRTAPPGVVVIITKDLHQ